MDLFVLRTGGRPARRFTVGLTLLALGLTACNAVPQDDPIATSGCDALATGRAAVGFFEALKGGDVNTVVDLLAEESPKFEDYGFFGLTVGEATTISRSEVPQLVSDVAGWLQNVRLTDVTVATDLSGPKADIVFRLVDGEREEIGKGAIRCADSRVITFNFRIPEEALGSNPIACGEEIGKSGDTRLCLGVP